MKYLELSIQSQTPLAVSVRSHNHKYHACLDWIPANSIRGALAAEAHRGRFPMIAEPDLKQIFGSHGVQFVDLLPTAHQYPERSLLTCSCRPGPKPYGHYQVDRLGLGLAKLLARTTQPPSVTCPVCGAQVGYQPDLVNQETGQRLQIVKKIVKRKRQSLSAHPAPHFIVGIETLPENMTFTGVVKVPEAVADAFQTLLTEVHDLALGSDRALGLGQVSVTFTQLTPVPVSLEDRVKAYAKRLTKTVGPLPDGLCVFGIGLQSELLLVDQLLRAQTEPTLAELAGTDPMPEWLKVFRLVEGYSALDTVKSYNNHPAVQMMRAPECVVLRGSIFVFANISAEGEIVPFDREHELYEFLAKAEACPRGELTHLGFGKIYVCSQDHYIREQTGSTTESEPRSVASPEEA